MFKKIVLAFILVVMLAAVSYLKSSRQQDKIDQVAKMQTESNAAELAGYQAKIDSLSANLTDRELAFADSLLNRDKLTRGATDSLANLLDSKDKTIASLQKQLKDVKAKLASSTKKSGTKQLSKHEKISKYYKQKYASLPNDLSEYERKIAINEIRQETAQKYSITLKELSSIRKKYKLP